MHERRKDAPSVGRWTTASNSCVLELPGEIPDERVVVAVDAFLSCDGLVGEEVDRLTVTIDVVEDMEVCVGASWDASAALRAVAVRREGVASALVAVDGQSVVVSPEMGGVLNRRHAVGERSSDALDGVDPNVAVAAFAIGIETVNWGRPA